MATVTMPYNSPAFILADTQADLDLTGQNFECQLTSAVLNPSVTFATVPSTGCKGPTQSPSAAQWTLTVAWLQDLTAPAGGLSGYSITNALQRKWFRLLPDKADTAVAAEGEVFITPGAVGGTFGDGSAPTATADWQCPDTPTFDFPALAATA